MVLKLIENGGFVGRSRSAELDMQTLSADEKQVLEDFFLAKKDKSTSAGGKGRDQFQYVIAYQGKSISLSEIPPANKLLAGIIENLMAQLQY